MTEREAIKGTYRHNKSGKLYEVIDVALHTETDEKMVIYQALYDSPDLAAEYGPNPYLCGLMRCSLSRLSWMVSCSRGLRNCSVRSVLY